MAPRCHFVTPRRSSASVGVQDNTGWGSSAKERKVSVATNLTALSSRGNYSRYSTQKAAERRINCRRCSSFNRLSPKAKGIDDVRTPETSPCPWPRLLFGHLYALIAVPA